MKKTNSFKNTIALKRGLYSVVLSVIFIVVIVALTVLSTVFAEKYPLDIDLTTNKQHSISDQNFDYIKNVGQKIDVYVTLKETEYSSATGTTADLGYIAASQHFVDYNSANLQYYTQSVELLKKYQSYNSNISVSFIDTYDSKTREITDKFTDFSWTIGDILVASTFTLDGKEVTRRTVVPFKETYTLEDLSGMAEQIAGNPMYQLYGYTATSGQGYGYFITENKIEDVLSSAIYKVTSPDTPLFLVPTAISSEGDVSEVLQNMLEVNNFAVEYNSDMLSILLAPENHKKYAGIILANCKADITADERAIIEDFLDNDGNKEKSLFYFAGVNTVKLTNLCGLLGDWGIGFESGILYETDDGFHASGEPTMIVLESAESDITKSADSLGKYYAGSNMVYMKQLWQDSTTATYIRETEALLNTGSFGMTTVMPLDANVKEWKVPSDAQKDKFVVALLSQDTKTVENKFKTSYIVAFASSEMISEDFSNNNFGNLNLVLDTFNEATGNTESPFNFVPKKIETQSYRASVTAAKTTAIKWIFMCVVPVILVGVGIFIWIWRRRK